MSQEQEGASGRKVIVDEVRRDPHSTRIESIYRRVEHVTDPKFDGIPVVIARKDTMESIHKLRADALAEQVEKIRVRRDSWRERYEQARADLEEHRNGREVLAELLAHNPVAQELRRERDEAEQARQRAQIRLSNERKRRLGTEVWAVLATGSWVAYAIAQAVLA